MDCKTAIALIDVYLDNELDRADARALEAHLDLCPDCAAALAGSDELRRALRDPALRHTAPEGLRDRIRAAMPASGESNRGRYRLRDRRPAWWQIAAACVLAFAAGGLMRPWDPGADSREAGSAVTHDLFASHWRALAAASPVDVVSSDHHTVKPWFAGRIAESPPVQDFAAQGFALAGGRIDYVGTQRVAVLVYRHGQHVIDVYVLPQAGTVTLPTHAESRGYSADAVTVGTEQMVIVSDMDATERGRLATMLRETH